jgi:EAL domain-containing protein (putative c-di-GMP-specific phosphodiesterase class I)
VHEGNTLDVGTSIGIANFPEHGDDAGVLLRRADMAMYAAKRSRSGQAIYDSSYDEVREGHLSLLTDLRRAICDGELMLYYQPKIDLKRRCVTGVEALLRWAHPTRGIVPPGEFIPFAEQTGFIKELTRWAVTRALDDSRAWAADGIEVRVSINVSARDLNREFPEMLGQQLRALDVPARNICLEITESALMESPENAQEILSQLHRLGVALSIDDYGTGYASLAYLKNFPVQEIKIDRVFIKNMAQSRTDAAIVRSTIELAHDLGLVVVGEGVEEGSDLELLAKEGCDYAQGYHMCRPLPAAEFVRWWKQSIWGARGAMPATQAVPGPAAALARA